MRNAIVTPAAIAALAPLASASFLMVADSTNDQIHILNSATGQPVELGAYDLNAAAAAENYTGTLLPKEPIEVGNQIWVTDQIADRVWRFDRDSRQPLPSFGAGLLNNVRGIAVVGNTAYLGVGSDGGLGEGLVLYDIANDQLSNATTGGQNTADVSYWGVHHYNNEILVSDIDTNNESIDRYDLAGNFLGTFATSDGVNSFDFVQQLATDQNGNLLAAGFSLPSGVYSFLPDGTSQGIVAGDGFGPRGIAQLDDGTILYSAGINLRTDSGVIIGDATGFDGSFQGINTISIPTPASAALLATAGLAATRRRR